MNETSLVPVAAFGFSGAAFPCWSLVFATHGGESGFAGFPSESKGEK